MKQESFKNLIKLTKDVKEKEDIFSKENIERITRENKEREDSQSYKYIKSKFEPTL